MNTVEDLYVKVYELYRICDNIMDDLQYQDSDNNCKSERNREWLHELRKHMDQIESMFGK